MREVGVELETEQLGEGVKKVILIGRLDLVGTGAVETRYTAETATAAVPIIVDLAGVDYLASIGLRLLVTSAKAQARQGGKLVLCSPQAMVKKILVTAGIDTLIPVFDDVAAAVRAIGPTSKAD
jgi:anti-anti-sigma factor